MVKNNVLPVLFAEDTSFIISNSNLRDMTHDVEVLDLIQEWYNVNILKKKKLRGLSPPANYTDREAAAGRRS